MDFESLVDCDLQSYSIDLCQKVKRWAGIPVLFSLAPTRTLAKIVNHMTKKCSRNSVFDIRSKKNEQKSFFSPEDLAKNDNLMKLINNINSDNLYFTSQKMSNQKRFLYELDRIKVKSDLHPLPLVI